MPSDQPEQQRRPRTGRPVKDPVARPSLAVTLTRYGLPAVILLAGVIFAIAWPGENGIDVLVGLAGVCACVVLFNLLLRLGASGDRERVVEARAREYYDAHGRWPDDRRPVP